MTTRLSRYSLRSRLRRLICLAALAPIFTLVYFISFWLRYENQLSSLGLPLFASTVLWVVGIKVLTFAWFRIYRSWGRYVTFHDLLVLAEAVTCSCLIMALVDYLCFPKLNIPRSIFLMDWGGTLVTIGGLRAMARLVREPGRLPFSSSIRQPVFIVGANDAGEALLREISRNRRLGFHVIGFIDDDPHRVGSRIGGVPVVGTVQETPRLAQRYGVKDVLITAGQLSGRQVRRLMEKGRRRGFSVKMLPSYEQLLRGSIDVRPRTVSIEDLLRREPVQLNMTELHQWIDDKVIMVTGSAGSIGSEICRQLLQFAPSKLVLVDRSETGQFFLERELHAISASTEIEVCLADLNDSLRMNHLLLEHRPDIVFHAAAYKHVPLMESHVGEAVKNISLTTRRLADLAHHHQVKSFVMISTDKAVNPTSVMGTCKRMAELYVQALAKRSSCRFVTVRFGNVLDSAGSVVPVFREQIARGGPISVTHPEMRRYFMTIPEASQLVIQAGAMGRGGEIFVLDMGQPVRIMDLATDLIRLSGLRVGEDIEIELVGMRPGEKLYEELHADGERHVATSHPKIMVAESATVAFAHVARALDDLANIADGPTEMVVDRLMQLVPQFTPDTARQPARSKAA